MLRKFAKGLPIASLVIAAFLVSSPKVEAAKIAVKNCQAETIRICVTDPQGNSGGSRKDGKVLKQNEGVHSSCKGPCAVSIITCESDNSCEGCNVVGKKVDGKVKNGDYAIVSLETSGKYSQTDNFIQQNETATKESASIVCP